MKTVNIHEAKTHLSRLIEDAVHGEGFIIAKAGKPMVQVTAIEAPERPARALGWMRGQFTVPDDFITMDADEIQAMFEGRAILEGEE
jgi:antitoxin (DNA-binding transcriptional repressor) of toxin-antitoxin stability system